MRQLSPIADEEVKVFENAQHPKVDDNGADEGVFGLLGAAMALNVKAVAVVRQGREYEQQGIGLFPVEIEHQTGCQQHAVAQVIYDLADGKYEF